jgi:hypothetical protein
MQMENNKSVSSVSDKIKEVIKSRNFLISAIALVIGSLAGFFYYYFGIAGSNKEIVITDAVYSIIWGGLLGLFVVNSPCSRGRC